MNTQTKTTTTSTGNNKSHADTEVTASELLRDGKKLANALYEEGLKKVNKTVNKTEDELKEYSDELMHKMQKNPITTLLIAGGVGFLLSLLLRK
jgi:ElaB/YqjD/DUF883 family membrane-anchored ribosome-binding protein